MNCLPPSCSRGSSTLSASSFLSPSTFPDTTSLQVNRSSSCLPSTVVSAVLKPSETFPPDLPAVLGLDLNVSSPPSLSQIISSFRTSGFQASKLETAVRLVTEMIRLRYPQCYSTPVSRNNVPPAAEQTNCVTCIPPLTLWLSFTSNLMSSGIRELLVFLAKHHLIDVLVTSAGGIEEDFVKCLAPTYVGEFEWQGTALRNKGWNRIGNLVCPNENYCKFEDWLQPLLTKLVQRQHTKLMGVFNISIQHTTTNISMQQTTTNISMATTKQDQFLSDQCPQEFMTTTTTQSKSNASANGSSSSLSSNVSPKLLPTTCSPPPVFSTLSYHVCVTPSELIDFLGSEINDERSLYYWCHRNRIPVFCPSITDGSLGDNLYFHTYKHTENEHYLQKGLSLFPESQSWTDRLSGPAGGLVIDVVRDIRRINDLAVKSLQSGVIILGGGMPKHHVLNANLMRNGADFAVYVNTGQEFDGSDSGARPDEAVSWGKIKSDKVSRINENTKGLEPNGDMGLAPNCPRSVKVCADATLVFPLIVMETFFKHLQSHDGCCTLKGCRTTSAPLLENLRTAGKI